MTTRLLQSSRLKRVYPYFRQSGVSTSDQVRKTYSHVLTAPLFEQIYEEVVYDPIPYIIYAYGNASRIAALNMQTLTGSIFFDNVVGAGSRRGWLFDNVSGSATGYPGSMIVIGDADNYDAASDKQSLFLVHPETGEITENPTVATRIDATYAQSPFLSIPNSTKQIVVHGVPSLGWPLFSIVNIQSGIFGAEREVLNSDLQGWSGGAIGFRSSFIVNNDLFTITSDQRVYKIDISNPLTTSFPSRYWTSGTWQEGYCCKHLYSTKFNRDQIANTYKTTSSASLYIVDRQTTNFVSSINIASTSAGSTTAATAFDYDSKNDNFWYASDHTLFVVKASTGQILTSSFITGLSDGLCNIAYQAEATGSYGFIDHRVLVNVPSTPHVVRVYNPDTYQLVATITNAASNNPYPTNITFHGINPGFGTTVASSGSSYISNFSWNRHVFWNDTTSPFITQSLFAHYTSDNVELGELSGSSGSVQYYYVNRILDGSGNGRHLVPATSNRCVWTSSGSYFGTGSAIVFRSSDQARYVMTGSNITFRDLLLNQYNLSIQNSASYPYVTKSLSSAKYDEFGCSVCYALVGSASTFSSPNIWTRDVIFGMMSTGSAFTDDEGWFVTIGKSGVANNTTAWAGYVVTGTQYIGTLNWAWPDAGTNRGHGLVISKNRNFYTLNMRTHKSVSTTSGDTSRYNYLFAQTASFELGKVGRGNYVNFALAELTLTRKQLSDRTSDLVTQRYYRTKYSLP